MAFPYLGEFGFEEGIAGTGNVLTDAEAKTLGYLHFSESVCRYGVPPYRGAYCWGLDQSIGVVTTTCQHTVAALNVANTNTWAAGCAIYLKDNVMANGNRTTLLEAFGVTDQGALQLYYTTAAGFQLLGSLAFDTAVGAGTRITTITENEWHWIEIRGQVQTGGTGTLDFFLDGRQIGAQIDTLTNVAITDLYFGAINADAGHTAGLIFFDDVICDGDAGTAVITVPAPDRFVWNPVVTKNSHVFVGPGTVSEVALLSGATADYVRLYDTDIAYTATGQQFVTEVNMTTSLSTSARAHGPFVFNRGCFVVVGGTNPRAQVHIDPSPPAGLPKCVCNSDQGLKYYGQVRTPTILNT